MFYHYKNLFLVISVEDAHSAQCGNDGNLLSRIFEKNFVKATFSSTKDVTKELISRKNLNDKILRFHNAQCTVWKLLQFSLTRFW